MVVKKNNRSKVKHSKLKRVKRTVKRSLKRRYFKNTKRKKFNRRTNRKRKTKRIMRMKGGMLRDTQGEEQLLESECYTPGKSTGKWNKRYAVLLPHGDLVIYTDQTKGNIHNTSLYNIQQIATQPVPRTVKWGPSPKDYYEFELDGKRYIFETEVMRNRFLEGITNILEGRKWNISRGEAAAAAAAAKRAEDEAAAAAAAKAAADRKKKEEEAAAAAKRAEKARIEEDARIADEESRVSADAEKEFSSIMWDDYAKLISLLNDLLPFNIKSINGFNNGQEGIIIIVTTEDNRIKVLKIVPSSVWWPANSNEEYRFLEKVNSIDPNITTKVEAFIPIKELRFVVGLKNLFLKYEEISQGEAKFPEIPFNLVEQLSRHVLNPLPPLQRPYKQLSFSIIVMEHLDGVSFQDYLRSKLGDMLDSHEKMIAFMKSDASVIDGDVKKVLEDFRQKINLLHMNGVYHCDLHWNNVMVLTDLSVRIIDFGNSKEIELSESTPKWGERGPCLANLAHVYEKPENFVEKFCPEPWYSKTSTCLD